MTIHGGNPSPAGRVSFVNRQPGNWAGVPNAGTNGTSPSIGQFAGIIYQLAPCKVDALGVTVLTAGITTGSVVVRAGLYAVDELTGLGTLLADSGPMDASSTGSKIGVLGSSAALPAGTYVLGAVTQGAATTNPAYTQPSGSYNAVLYANGGLTGFPNIGFSLGAAVAALPASASFVSIGNTGAVLTSARFAA